MGNSSKKVATRKGAGLELVFSALGSPVRRQILLNVAGQGNAMTAGDIARSFKQAWPTTTRHLKVLERAGLLSIERSGRSRIYRVHQSRLDMIHDWLAAFEPDRRDSPDGAPQLNEAGPGRSSPAGWDADSLVGGEWAEWYRLTPAERWQESERAWLTYMALGGSLDPEPDTQSPFFDAGEPGHGPSHGRTGVRVLRRGGV